MEWQKSNCLCLSDVLCLVYSVYLFAVVVCLRDGGEPSKWRVIYSNAISYVD